MYPSQPNPARAGFLFNCVRFPPVLCLAVMMLVGVCGSLVEVRAQTSVIDQLGAASPEWIEENYTRVVAAMRRDAFGWTPLMVSAAGQNQADSIGRLLELGEDPQARSLDDWNALMFASAFNPDPDIVLALIHAGADPNSRSRDAWSALFGAARYTGENLRFDALAGIEGGAGFGFVPDESRGWTPLFFAARFNRAPAVVRSLIEAGADPDAHDEYGRTALHYALHHNPEPGVARALKRSP